MKSLTTALLLASVTLAACGSAPAAEEAAPTGLTWAVETQPITLNQDDAYEIFENSRGDSDAGAALNLLLPGKGALNRTHYPDAGVEKAIAEAGSSSDQARRAKLYAEVQRVVVRDKAIVFPIYVPADQIAARKSVRGLGFDPASGTPASAYDVRIET